MIRKPFHRLILLAALGFGPGTVLSAWAEERMLGAPVFDHATETTYRQVTWDDFKGTGRAPPGSNRWRKGSFAHIATEVRLGRFRVETIRDGEGWLARPVGVRPYAVMNKDFSAVKHGSRNAYTLDHEQLHFDIAETMARRLAAEMIPLRGRGASQEEAGEDLARQIRERYAAGIEELQRLQSAYDGETANAQRKKQQKKWAQRVPEMFREASEALAAALEATGGLDR